MVDQSTSLSPLPLFDATARKAHQWVMVALVTSGFLLGDPLGALPLAIAGGVMLVGRFWWPADLVRQFVWRVLEPAGLLRRRQVHEDHATRRVARVLGGVLWLLAAALITVGAGPAAWILSGLIAVMVVLDASVDFCALCFVFSTLERRGLLPPALAHGAARG